MQHEQKTPAIGQDSGGHKKGSLARQNRNAKGILRKFFNSFQREVSHA
jgi:hypothetical protein